MESLADRLSRVQRIMAGARQTDTGLLAVWQHDLDAVREAVVVLRRQAVPTIDLDKVFFDDLTKAATESKWIPPEYMANDWVSDCCKFLREGPEAFVQQESVAEVLGWVNTLPERS